MSQEGKILITIKEFANKLPKLPDGRIDYHNSDTAPVVDVFVKYQDRILLLKRSDKVGTYQGKWNCISGYLDEVKSIYQKALEEIKEELDIDRDNVLSMRLGETYSFTDERIGKTYIVHPILVELKNQPAIRLDFEHTEYRWIKPEELKDFDIVPNTDKGLEKVIHLV